MRILHLLNHTRQLNGHVHAAVDLACAQAGKGHTVWIGCGDGDFGPLLAANGVQCLSIPHHRRPLEVAKGLGRLHHHLKTLRPDVVHAHMMTSALLAWPVCRLTGIPLITTVHNEFEKSAILMGLGTRVIAVSEAVRASMAARGIPARRLVTVLNGTIGSVRFQGRSDEAETLGSPSILFVGGLHPRKGLPDLLTAFDEVHARHPKARLHVVGAGPFAADYAARAREMACAEAVNFAGGQLDPRRWMRGADIFVLPSHAEPAGLVLSEAREAGCAVIGTAVGGIPEMLEHGKAGILVPPRDPHALASALLGLLDDPASLACWRGRSQHNISRMSVARVMQETLNVYEDALLQSNRRLFHRSA